MAAVLLTQPEPRVGSLVDEIRAASLEPITLCFSRLDRLDEGCHELQSLNPGGFDRIVFVSPSAVWFSGDQIDRLAAGCPNGLAVIGAGTEAALFSHLDGLIPIRPKHAPFDADALLALPEMQAPLVRSVLVIRGAHGRDDWIEQYRKAGVQVTVVLLYTRQVQTPSPASAARVGQLAHANDPALILVTSVALANQLCHWQPSRAVAHWLRRQTCLVSHPRVAAKLTDGGFGATIQAAEHGSMVSGAIQWWQTRLVP